MRCKARFSLICSSVVLLGSYLIAFTAPARAQDPVAVSAKTVNNSTTGVATTFTLIARPAGATVCGLGNLVNLVFAPMTFLGFDAFSRPLYATAAHTQVYVDPGEQLQIHIDHLNFVGSEVVYQVAIAGHLVSVP